MSPSLAFEEVRPRDGDPSRWSWFLHGIFGAGRNWRSLARRLVEEVPDRGAVLPDLRLHGESTGLSAPHTLDSCAGDLGRLARGPAPAADSWVGHSFGGKVGLAALAEGPPDLRQLWVVDSTPSAREPRGDAVRLLETLRELPGPFASRDAGVAAVEERGFSRRVARFMGTNLEERDGEWRWRLDLDGVESLLMDFFHTDLWSVVEDPPEGVTVHFVKAEDSDVLAESDCRRLEAAGEAHGRVRLHRLPGGHWLNITNPDDLVELMRDRMPR